LDQYYDFKNIFGQKLDARIGFLMKCVLLFNAQKGHNIFWRNLATIAEIALPNNNGPRTQKSTE
jgi:hypothetical protein